MTDCAGARAELAESDMTIRESKVLFDESSINATEYALRLFSFRHQATIQATDLDPTDVITFEILHLKSGTPDELCGCFISPGKLPAVDSIQTLMCTSCEEGVPVGTPVQLTADNPVVILNAPQGAIIRAKYTGPGLGFSFVWATLETDTTMLLPGQNGCPEGCCVSDPLSWTSTGETRCNLVTGYVEVLMEDNCGNREWQQTVLITWTPTGDIRCTSPTTTEAEEVNDCGGTRWVPGPPNEWHRTGEAQCDSFTSTGATYTVIYQEADLCGNIRWTAPVAVEWDDTGVYRCTDAGDEMQQTTVCGDFRWVPAGPATWTDTGETRCVGNVIEVQQTNLCGHFRWEATATPCGYIATLPLDCGGTAFRPGEQPPDATVPLEDCDGNILGYIYPDARADASIPVTEGCMGCGDGGGPVLGYASNHTIPTCAGPTHVMFDDYLGVNILNWPDFDICAHVSQDPNNILQCVNGQLFIRISDETNNCIILNDDGIYVECTDDSCIGMSSSFSVGMNELTGTFIDASSPSVGQTIASWSWSFGDGATSSAQNPIHTYASGGVYGIVLTVTDTAGCVDTSTRVVNAAMDCTGMGCDFTTAVNGLDAAFTDASTPSAGETLVSWAWDFGDGTPAGTTQNPTHTYAVSGTYAISLTVTDSKGCTDTKNTIVSVAEGCVGIVADFTYVETGLSAAFTDTSVASTGETIASWSWDFGDATTSSVQNPNHVYGSGGNYTVELTIVDTAGCMAIRTVNLDVVDPCAAMNAEFTSAPDAATDFAIDFNAAASTPSTGGTITTYSWDFGDTSPAGTGVNPTHTYSGAGTFTVTLTATDSNGCVDSVQHQVTAAVSCLGIDAIFTATPDTSDDFIVDFDASASAPANGATITSYSWDFGDASPTGTGATPTHTYAAAGSYTVLLTITDSKGCTDTYQLPVTAAVSCVGMAAGFTVSENQLVVTLTDTTTPPTGDTITAWDWDFGDGTPHGTTQNPVHTYATAGSYTITLIATASNGCTDTDAQPITVAACAGINAAFTWAEDAAIDYQVDFNAASSVPSTGETITSYSWDFGDTSPAGTGVSPSHTYSGPGTFVVTLTITDSNGCTDQVTHSATADEVPDPCAGLVADFTMAIVGNQVTFTNTTTGASGSATYAWDFTNDGSTDSTLENPTHLYVAGGPFTAELTVTDGACVDTITHTVASPANCDTVASVTATVDATDTMLVHFDASASTVATGCTSGSVSYQWDFDGDAVFDQTTSSPTVDHTFSTPGTYTATVRVTDGCGCFDEDTATFTVSGEAEFSPVLPTLFETSPSNPTQPASLELTLLPDGTYAYETQKNGLPPNNLGGHWFSGGTVTGIGSDYTFWVDDSGLTGGGTLTAPSSPVSLSTSRSCLLQVPAGSDAGGSIVIHIDHVSNGADTLTHTINISVDN